MDRDGETGGWSNRAIEQSRHAHAHVRGLKKSTLVQGLGRPQNRHAPLEEVVVRQPGRESVHRVLCQLLQLLTQQERTLIRRHIRGHVFSHAERHRAENRRE